MTTADRILEAEGLLDVLELWHAQQHGWVGASFLPELPDPVRETIAVTRKAIDVTERAGRAAASSAWSAAEDYAYRALKSANIDLQKTLSDLAQLAMSMRAQAQSYAQASAEAAVDTFWAEIKTAGSALWSRAQDVFATVAPWILLGGGLLWLLSGGLPGVALGAAALWGGASLLTKTSPLAYTASGPAALTSSVTAAFSS